ncbi:MAG: hypothetical protein QM757_16040 [Paludibaculum sp.]
MQRNWLALSLVFGTLTLTGCDIDPSDWGNSDRYKEEFSYQHKLNPGGRVVLETFNGSVEVLGSDGDRVDISGTKYAFPRRDHEGSQDRRHLRSRLDSHSGAAPCGSELQLRSPLRRQGPQEGRSRQRPTPMAACASSPSRAMPG